MQLYLTQITMIAQMRYTQLQSLLEFNNDYNMVRWISASGTMHFRPQYDTFWPCGLFTLLQFYKHPLQNQHETQMSK